MAWRNPFSRGASHKAGEALPTAPPLGVTTGFGSGRLQSLLNTILPGTRYNYVAEAGDISLNSIVAACLRFYTLNMPQARPRVARLDPKTGTEKLIADHEVVTLLMRPDPTMGRADYLEQLLIDYFVHGNAYEYKRRGGGGIGRTQKLQWLPADMVTERKTPIGVVYDYRVQGRMVATIPAADMIHHRMGRDPDNLLRGRSYLVSVLREIAADNSHSTASGAMSRNLGIASWLIGPKGPVTPTAPYASDTQTNAEVVAKRVSELTTGDKTGGAVGLSGDFHAERLSFSPNEMALDKVRQTPEERVCAVFSISPIVVHLGAGLQRSTFSNYKESIQSAWENAILPLLDYFASNYTQGLLEESGDYQPGDEIVYETTRVRALRDDESVKAKDAAIAYRSGVWDRATSKKHSGKLALPEDEGLYAVNPASASAEGGSPGTMLATLANAAGILIRSGFEPSAVANLVGLSIPHTGAAPVTLREESDPTAPVKSITWLAVKKDPDPLGVARRARSELVGIEQTTQEAVREVFASAKDALEQAVAELETELLALEQSGQTITPGLVQSLDRYKTLLQQAELELSLLATDAATATQQGQQDGATAGASAAQSLTQAMASAAGVAVNWNALPAATLTTLAGNLADGTPLADHFGTLGIDLRKGLAATIAKGLGADATAAALRGQLGLTFSRAETIARTETIRAYREASRLSYAANSSVVQGYSRLCALDTRTCAACWALHGSEHPTSEIMPSHPNCRCVMVPQVVGGPALPDRDAAFAALGETGQRSVLGAGGYELFAQGTPLASFAVVSTDPRFGPTARVATLSELGGTSS